MLNGDGIRVVLWLAGCAHACPGCHNPITWDPNGGLPFDELAAEEIYEELDKDYVSGLTFSGGDPLHPANLKGVTKLARQLRQRYPNKTLWLYTGSRWDEIKDLEVIQYLDVVVDGRFEADKKDESLHWKGSSNQMVIDVKNTREVGLVVLHD